MTEMDEFRLRLTAVENEQATIREYASKGRCAFDMFTAIDRDLADVRTAFHQQRTMLNAIGLPQAEHTVTLREQSKILGGLVIEVAGHGKTLAEQRRTLAEHRKMLGEHTIMLEEQSKMLCEQGTTLGELKEQGAMMRDQLREILGRLPAAGG
ncbi:MAG: hypothetical protein ACJ768_01255 [Gaiellaceae bacterium]